MLAELYFNWVYLQHIAWYKVLLAVPHFNPETNTRVPLCPAICILQKKRTVLPAKRSYRIHHPYSWRKPNLCETRKTSSQHREGRRENKFTIPWPGRDWISAGYPVTRDGRIHRKLGRPIHVYTPNHNRNLSQLTIFGSKNIHINWGCWQSYITLSVLTFVVMKAKVNYFIVQHQSASRSICPARRQPGRVSKFLPFLWVNSCGEYIELSRYLPASWINRFTLITKIKLLCLLGY